LLANLERARRREAPLAPEAPFGLVTLHRPANVDDPASLAEILSALAEISREVLLIFPVHPRTRQQLESAGLDGFGESIRLLDPLGYLDFLNLMTRASVVLTDSGGIQEETTALGVPCLTLRENTERPITITEGTNRLAGTTRESILGAWRQHREHPKRGRIPKLWDGNAAARSVAALRKHLCGSP